ncbi:hypothetical protein [Nisaea sp.]|uniref:hypothetical protein n=1 Tax=Nisaea sp. TaxID=2024842 RepID=UPI003262F713
MRTVNLSFEFEAAESLLQTLNGGKIADDMRDHLVRVVENSIREASAPGSRKPKPRYVGEHGESDK